MIKACFIVISWERRTFSRGTRRETLPWSSFVIVLWSCVCACLCKEVVWCGVVWCGVVWCGVVWCGVVWCGVVWCGVVWCGVVWCGVVWCGVVWCGVVWCGVVVVVVWCGVVLCCVAVWGWCLARARVCVSRVYGVCGVCACVSVFVHFEQRWKLAWFLLTAKGENWLNTHYKRRKEIACGATAKNMHDTNFQYEFKRVASLSTWNAHSFRIFATRCHGLLVVFFHPDFLSSTPQKSAKITSRKKLRAASARVGPCWALFQTVDCFFNRTHEILRHIIEQHVMEQNGTENITEGDRQIEREEQTVEQNWVDTVKWN